MCTEFSKLNSKKTTTIQLEHGQKTPRETFHQRWYTDGT